MYPVWYACWSSRNYAPILSTGYSLALWTVEIWGIYEVNFFYDRKHYLPVYGFQLHDVLLTEITARMTWTLITKK